MAILNNSNAISAGGYDINNSLRFRSSANAYLNRTFATPTSDKIFTFSGWIKRGALGVRQGIFVATNAGVTSYFAIQFLATDLIDIQGSNGSWDIQTTQVFRDPSAWYHIVVAVDTTQATSSNRIKLYVNGSQVTAFGTASYPTLNSSNYANSAVSHSIGSWQPGSTFYYDGYLTEVNVIDGQALTPSSFGATDATTGVWQPKAYTSTYGTNGFYLKFSDIATTSGSNAGLGKDFSGNTNYWTTNNISVTAGTTYDAMKDVPTLTSATVSNYCVLNPLQSYAAPTEANLNFTTGAAYRTAASTYYVSSGKWYWEATFVSGTFLVLGISAPASFQTVLSTYTGATATSYSYSSDAGKWNNNAQTPYGATFTTNDVIGVALDMDAGTITFYKNNVSQGTAFTGLSGLFTPTFSPYSCTVAVNFGQRPFTYTPPTGYVALNTYNLPTPTILQGNKYMDATTYTGTGASLSVTNASAFKPDFVWVKGRSGATDHALYDSVRGTTKDLVSNSTAAETTQAQGLTAFGTGGFTVGTLAKMNTNAATYVGWQWQAGQGSTSSNTSGSITSTVSVNATAGFSVVTYTGTGANATVGHGLGVAPAMVIVKRRNSTGNWNVRHVSITAANSLYLNLTNASQSDPTVWNSTVPTSTVFSIGTDTGVNASGGTYVAYCWAAISGFSAFGSYTGNGSTDGPFVYLGFRPKWVLIKRTDSSTSGNWSLLDSSINTYNEAQKILTPNTADSESTQNYLDLLSNGFKVRYAAANQQINTNGGSYIYAAFAENPFKNANAR